MKKNRLMTRLGMIILTAFVLSAAGCVSDDDFRRQVLRVNQLQQEVRDLKDESKLRKMEMDRLLGQARGSMPEMRLEIDRLRTELQRLTDTIDLAETRAGLPPGEKLSLRNQLEYTGARLDRLEAKFQLPPLSPKVVEEAGLPKMPAEPRIEIKPEAEEPAESTEDGEYNAAKESLKKKAYPEALDKFRNFLTKYPKSKYASSAQYNAGECLYLQQKYDEAILEFQKIIKDHAASDLVPPALLRQAFSFLSLGDKTSAKLLLQKIVRQYPKSSAAATAKEKLATLN
ncbi:MAG: tol-pal system protein YbgF [Thermodesulfobacteriota bacterium]